MKFQSFFPNRLANNTDQTGLIGLANDLSFAADDWIQITPIGDFPHRQGIQRVDRTAIEKMANSFNSMLGKVKRAMVGVGWFIGHPHTKGLENIFSDRSAYGWIKKLEARPDGLYAQTEFNESGKSLIDTKRYRSFSPVWDVEKIGTENGRSILRPINLAEVGFTNTPNIPVIPLSNSMRDQIAIMDTSILIALLQLANDASEDAIKTRITDLMGKTTEVTRLQNEKQTAETTLANERTAKTTLENQFKAERAERITLVLSNAITAGRITGAQLPEWKTKLENSFDTESATLAKLTPVIKTKPITERLGNRKVEGQTEEQPGQKATRLANERMNEKRCTFDEAWKAVRIENPALFEAMQKPEVL